MVPEKELAEALANMFTSTPTMYVVEVDDEDGRIKEGSYHFTLTGAIEAFAWYVHAQMQHYGYSPKIGTMNTPEIKIRPWQAGGVRLSATEGAMIFEGSCNHVYLYKERIEP